MKADKVAILQFLQEIKPDLQNDGILKIGLFGSFSRDEAGVYSDIDIAIQKQTNYLSNRTAYEYFEQVNTIKSLVRKKFHRNSDVFDLDSNSTMKDSIMKDLIYV